MLEEIRDYILETYNIEFELKDNVLTYTSAKITYQFKQYSENEIEVITIDEKSVVSGVETYKGNETIDMILKDNWKLVK